jgi:hypothetical protein
MAIRNAFHPSVRGHRASAGWSASPDETQHFRDPLRIIRTSYKFLRQLKTQIVGKTQTRELPPPISKAQPHFELLIFFRRQVG